MRASEVSFRGPFRGRWNGYRISGPSHGNGFGLVGLGDAEGDLLTDPEGTEESVRPRFAGGPASQSFLGAVLGPDPKALLLERGGQLIQLTPQPLLCLDSITPLARAHLRAQRLGWNTPRLGLVIPPERALAALELSGSPGLLTELLPETQGQTAESLDRATCLLLDPFGLDPELHPGLFGAGSVGVVERDSDLQNRFAAVLPHTYSDPRVAAVIGSSITVREADDEDWDYESPQDKAGQSHPHLDYRLTAPYLSCIRFDDFSPLLCYFCFRFLLWDGQSGTSWGI